MASFCLLLVEKAYVFLSPIEVQTANGLSVVVIDQDAAVALRIAHRDIAVHVLVFSLLGGHLLGWAYGELRRSGLLAPTFLS